MQVKDQYYHLYWIRQEVKEDRWKQLRTGDVIANLNPGKDWFIFHPKVHAEFQFTSAHRALRPRFPLSGMAYPPIYLIALWKAYRKEWPTQGMMGLYDFKKIRQFEFPHPPPPIEELRKVEKFERKVGQLSEAYNKKAELLLQLHECLLKRVVVEGKPLSLGKKLNITL